APGETTLFVAGHGTERNENSRKAMAFHAERIGKLYAAVHAVFMEEKPRIADCYELAQTRHMVVVPFLISDGLHTRQDIPIMLGEPEQVVQRRVRASQAGWRNPTERRGKLVWYSAAVGSAALVSEVILERVREACRE